MFDEVDPLKVVLEEHGVEDAGLRLGEQVVVVGEHGIGELVLLPCLYVLHDDVHTSLYVELPVVHPVELYRCIIGVTPEHDLVGVSFYDFLADFVQETGFTRALYPCDLHEDAALIWVSLNDAFKDTDALHLFLQQPPPTIIVVRCCQCRMHLHVHGQATRRSPVDT